MSTPEIDIHNMLEREAYDEVEDEAYEHWLEYDVIPDLTKLLSLFQYDKFDNLVGWYDLEPPEPIVEWLWRSVQEDFDVYWAFMNQERSDVDFRGLVEAYVNSFVCIENFIEYNRAREDERN
jgi:hypothetical protein